MVLLTFSYFNVRLNLWINGSINSTIIKGIYWKWYWKDIEGLKKHAVPLLPGLPGLFYWGSRHLHRVPPHPPRHWFHSSPGSLGKEEKVLMILINQKNYFFCGKLITLMGVWKLRCNHKDLHNVNCFLKICWTLISMDIIVQSIHVQMLVWQYILLARPLSTNVCSYSWY